MHYTYLDISHQIARKKINILRGSQINTIFFYVVVRINTVDSVTTPIGDLELGRKVNFYGLKCVLGGRTLDGLDGSLRLNCTIKEERALNEQNTKWLGEWKQDCAQLLGQQSNKSWCCAWGQNVHLLETTSTISRVRSVLALSCKCNGLGTWG